MTRGQKVFSLIVAGIMFALAVTALAFDVEGIAWFITWYVLIVSAITFASTAILLTADN
ncbi:hypothetical protein [Nonomuraea gerenzanensis]|uniref:Uncharacterized protein n=1 Tax=Nonomuraea gerenzanensis TaxID=93944 RepID=A0A1M4DVI2_9ACTN|nr:hypothetical protein [Nonomuraea gerenzanensis]UBU12948.1 hypothetical protein LCN96_53355 [Nonomuraea gerenzanensis]SBO90587.1 hypothetical protein BN4615_P101 [Nonomuraea gerenzanensis]